MAMAAQSRPQGAEQDTRAPGCQGRSTRAGSPARTRSIVPSLLPADTAAPHRSLSEASWELIGPPKATSRSSFSDWELLGGSPRAEAEHTDEETMFTLEGEGGEAEGASGRMTPGQAAAKLLEDHLLPSGLLPLGSLEKFTVDRGEFTAVLGETAERELSGFRIHYCSRISGSVEMGMVVQIKGIYLWDALLHLPVRMPVRKIRAHGPENPYVDFSLGLQSIQLSKSALGEGGAGDFLWHGLQGNRDLSCTQGLGQEGGSQPCSAAQRCSGMQHSFSEEAGNASPGSWRLRTGRASSIGHLRGDGVFGSPQRGRAVPAMACRVRAHRRQHSGKAVLEV